MVGYEWVESLEAFCFTAVVGLDPDETVAPARRRPRAASEPRTFDECFWAADGPQWAQVGPVDGGVLVAENNGWRAEECIERLSKDVRVACFFRNVQAVMHFVYAVDGTGAGRVRPAGRAAGRRGGADPSRHRAGAWTGLPFGLFAAEPSALTLLERLTGVRVARDLAGLPAAGGRPAAAALNPPVYAAADVHGAAAVRTRRRLAADPRRRSGTSSSTGRGIRRPRTGRTRPAWSAAGTGPAGGTWLAVAPASPVGGGAAQRGTPCRRCRRGVRPTRGDAGAGRADRQRLD